MTDTSYNEVDMDVIARLCAPYPDDHDIVVRAKTMPGAMQMKGWVNHFEWLHLVQFLDPGTRILDFGCGCGHSDVFLALLGYNVCGYEPDPLALSIAEYVGSLQASEVQNRLLFTKELPSFKGDMIWSSHVFEHIPIVEWKNVFRSLNHSRIHISVPLGHGYDWPSHVNHWMDQSELERDLVANGAYVNDIQTDLTTWVIRAWVSSQPNIALT